MSRLRHKRTFQSLLRTIILMTIAAALLIIGGMPVVNMTKAYWKMMIVKGVPHSPNEFDTDVSLFVKKRGQETMSEIQVPYLGTHYGNIYCDRIDLTAPVYYGDTEEIFLEGAGQYSGSGLPGVGKPILIGGHDITYFAPLEYIELGDIITIETNYGEFSYRVISTLITQGDDMSAYDLDLQEEQLILYTCYPFGKVVGERERFFIYGERITN